MKRLSSTVLWLAALVVTACALLVYESHLLWKLQEMNLFLCSELFFSQQMVVPGGLLTWAGTFLTQFFYYPWVGVVLLCALWWLLMWMVVKTFRLPTRWAVVALIPVALILITIVDMGYWVYMLKLRGHVFVTTLGTLSAIGLLWAFRSISASWLRMVFIALACAVGFPLIGIYGLAAVLVMAVWSWRIEPKGKATVNSVVALLCIVAVPLICYRYMYHETNLANIFWAELPLYYIREDYQQYYIPFYLLLLFFIGAAIVSPSLWLNPTPSGGEDQRRKIFHKVSLSTLYQLIVVAAVAVGVYLSWYKDENFHRELVMEHSIDGLNWEGVLDEARRQQDEPTRSIVMMKNLALSRQGRQGSEMFLYKNGSKKSNAPFDVRLMQVIGPLIYYHYGVTNYTTRLCTEMGVEYGWRKEYLKLMTRCALLMGEKQVAKKYIGILKQSLFTGDFTTWAENLLAHPNQIAKDEETGYITRMMHYGNILASDEGYPERFIMRSLAVNRYTGDPLFQEQALLATLWTKDVPSFWQRFYDYIRLHPNVAMPRYYQEAAYLYSKQEGRTIGRAPFDQMVKDNYDRFMKIAPNYEGADFEVARDALYPLFGQTYYFDYFVMRNLPEY